MIAKKYANRLEGDEVIAETSGSELVMAYSPGTFAAPLSASAGDRLGTITWEDLSINDRTDATAMEIFGLVEAVAADGSAIKGTMNFGVGSAVAGEPIQTHLKIGLGEIYATGSNISQTGRMLTIGNTADADADTYINFLTNTADKRWVAGIDVTAAAFIIDANSNNVPQATSDFSLASGGALTLLGSLTSTTINTGNGATEIYDMNQDVKTGDDVIFAKVTTAANPSFTGSTVLHNIEMKGFTGSTITVDGGTF